VAIVPSSTFDPTNFAESPGLGKAYAAGQPGLDPRRFARPWMSIAMIGGSRGLKGMPEKLRAHEPLEGPQNLR
jgi:hypothetical protein